MGSVVGPEDWSSNGTEAGTVLEVELEPGPGSFDAELLVSLGDRLIVSGFSSTEGEGLWVTDGTAAGTGPLLDRDGMEIYAPGRFAALGDRLLFTTRNDVPLWESDGTPAGTFRLVPKTQPGYDSPQELVRAGDRVFFPAHDRETGTEFWAVRPKTGDVPVCVGMVFNVKRRPATSSRRV